MSRLVGRKKLPAGGAFATTNEYPTVCFAAAATRTLRRPARRHGLELRRDPDMSTAMMSSEETAVVEEQPGFRFVPRTVSAAAAAGARTLDHFLSPTYTTRPLLSLLT